MVHVVINLYDRYTAMTDMVSPYGFITISGITSKWYHHI